MGNGYLHKGHRERLRRRFVYGTSDVFYEHEMLELLLFYAIPRINTNELAHELINHFGSLEKVIKADPKELVKFKGIGNASARFIHIAAEVAEHLKNIERVLIKLDTTDVIKKHMSGLFEKCESDTFFIINLDLSLNVKNTICYPYEDVLTEKVPTKEIIRRIFINNTRRIIIGICHPERMPIPDKKDYDIVTSLNDLLSNLDVKFVDTVIGGMGKTISLRECGTYGFTPK